MKMSGNITRSNRVKYKNRKIQTEKHPNGVIYYTALWCPKGNGRSPIK